ncbi:MAG: DUF1206 domain-containing protein [Caulobacteraceae bacterium]|nr:DUF1206 domain-containing protein [Caulobacteraceae bacterium]
MRAALRRAGEPRGGRLEQAVETVARAGYAARGFLYTSIGLIALLTAVGLAEGAANGFRVLETVARWPLGFVWLSLIALCLGGFALWRGAQVFLDHDRQGSHLRAVLSRLGQAVSGLVYGALALSVFDLLDAVEDRLQPHTATDQAEAIMAWPGGQLILLATGVFVIGSGIGNIAQAALADFGRRLDCPAAARPWFHWCGRIGYAARGVAFLPLGAFLIEAALDLDPRQARDFGGALQSLRDQPFGVVVMGLTAAGLVAFGAFALVEAMFRRIPAR